jgi:hypothetical protein
VRPVQTEDDERGGRLVLDVGRALGEPMHAGEHAPVALFAQRGDELGVDLGDVVAVGELLHDP